MGWAQKKCPQRLVWCHDLTKEVYAFRGLSVDAWYNRWCGTQQLFPGEEPYLGHHIAITLQASRCAFHVIFIASHLDSGFWPKAKISQAGKYGRMIEVSPACNAPSTDTAETFVRQ